MTQPPARIFAGPTPSRIGPLDFEAGYPSAATTQHLFDELDFQRAVQCYLWAIPYVSFGQWQDEHASVFDAHDGDLVRYDSFRDKLGLLTANATTPYLVGFVHLGRTGPLVVDVPAGPLAGGVLDFWQRPCSDLGLTGPDGGAGGRYLVLGPGQQAPDITVDHHIEVPTLNMFIATRVLAPDPNDAAALAAAFRFYPASTIAEPQANRIVPAAGRVWSGMQPRGLDYWRVLARLVDDEPVNERDRIMVAMLEHLGIVKGRTFAPDERQRAILEQATLVGEAMNRAIGFEPRFEGATIYPGRAWKIALFLDASQEGEHATQLDERTAWFYEAVTASKGMTTTTPGQGQVYLHVDKDASGEWLRGDHTYELTVPADAPVLQFWSFTAYDIDTRCFIDNPHDRADRSSRDDLIVNADGSVTLQIGPDEPDDARNWIPTVRGQGWFGYFRLYAPTAAYFDRSWQLPDLRRID